MRPGTSSNSLVSAKGRSADVQRWQRSAAGNGRARARTRPPMLRAAVASVSRPPSCVAASAIAGYPVCPLLTAPPITALAGLHPTFARFPAISGPESRLRPPFACGEGDLSLPKPGKAAEVARGVADVGDRKIAECRQVEIEQRRAGAGVGPLRRELASITAEVPAAKKGSPFHRSALPR